MSERELVIYRDVTYIAEHKSFISQIFLSRNMDMHTETLRVRLMVENSGSSSSTTHCSGSCSLVINFFFSGRFASPSPPPINK